MLWHCIYNRAERNHRSTVVINNFEHITPPSSVSTVTSNMYFLLGLIFQLLLD